MKKNDDTIQQETTEEMPEELDEQVLENEELADELQEVDTEDEKTHAPAQDASQWEEKYKRALADYQNLEKRVATQRRELILSAGKQILMNLLPVLDTLQLAAKHTKDQGLSVSVQQFLDVLKSEGVEKIETTGKKFDPSTMEAVGTGNGEEGKVIEEARAGYMLHESLLRPAQVIVGRKE